MKKIIFLLFFSIGTSMVNTNGIFWKLLDLLLTINTQLIIIPIIVTVFYFAGLYILADIIYNKVTWYRMFIKKFKISLTNFTNITNILNFILMIIFNLRKLKLHRGLR